MYSEFRVKNFFRVALQKMRLLAAEKVIKVFTQMSTARRGLHHVHYLTGGHTADILLYNYLRNQSN